MKAISSEDPRAVELLTEKLTALEKSRDQMKEINKDFRQAGGDASKMKIIPENLRERMIAAVEKGYSWEKQPYPKWKITNIGARIRDIKKRITHLEKVATEETSEYETNGVRVLDNCEEHRLQLFFPDKPEREVRQKLKGFGFRWSPTNGCWQSYRGRYQNDRAKRILEAYNLRIEGSLKITA